MYNRYIPQSDGSFQRNQVAENLHTQSPHSQPAPNTSCSTQVQSSDKSENYSKTSSAGSFLRQLLPTDIDTGDLLVIVLLLLIAGDTGENRGNALLTLALYLFL